MKSLIFTAMMIICSNGALGCLKNYEVNSDMFKVLPIKVKAEKLSTSTSYYLYLNDAGNFEGLHSVGISIKNLKKEEIYWGSVELGNKTPDGIFLSMFSVSNEMIENSYLTVRGKDPYIEHSTIYEYKISLYLLLQMSLGKEETMETIQDSLQDSRFVITRE